MRGYLTFAFVCLVAVQSLPAEARNRDWRSGRPSAVDNAREDTLRNLPECLDKQGNRLDVGNEQVIRWKTTTPNQYRDRALIIGTLVGVLKDKGDHLHLDVFLGETLGGRGKESDIEIIYNKSFGRVDNPQTGAEVAACGDFINSFEPAGHYPASPVGAIIHWVHKSNNPSKHEHGFLAIDGKVYGDQGDYLNGDSRRGRGGNRFGGDSENRFEGLVPSLFFWQ